MEQHTNHPPKLGILGGMGPQATLVFYQYVLDRTDATCDQEHLSAVILSDTGMPDRTAAIQAGQQAQEEVAQRLLADARQLQDMGCTAIAVTCNTAHYFLDRIQGELTVPIVHMVRETAKRLHAQGRRSTVVLGTDGTVQTQLYQTECAKLGIACLAPDADTQKIVMSIIYDEIKRGERGSREKFQRVHLAVETLGCDCAILACTELSTFRNYHALPPFYVDAMEVLAEECLMRCGQRLRTI